MPEVVLIAVLRSIATCRLCASHYGTSFLILQMDLSVLYGSGPFESAPLDSSNISGLGTGSMPVPQSSQEVQFGYRDSGGRAFNREDCGDVGNNTDRLDDMPLFNGTSKLKGAPRKMMPGPQQKGPANVKRGYRQVLLASSAHTALSVPSICLKCSAASLCQEVSLHASAIQKLSR